MLGYPADVFNVHASLLERSGKTRWNHLIRFNVVTGVKGDCLRFMFSWCKLALAKLQNHERQSILLLIYFLSKWDWKGILGFDFEKQQKTWR